MDFGKLLVEEYTTPCAVSAKSDTSVQKVKQMMDEGGFRHIPILEENEVVGIISDRDLKVLEKVWEGMDILAKDIMTTNPYVVSPEVPLDEVVFEMSKNKYGSAVVKSGEEDFLGIFTLTDALNALIEILREEVAQ